MVYLKTMFLTKFGLLRRLHHLSRSFFALIFSIFLPYNKIGFHTTFKVFFFLSSSPNGKINGLTSLLNPRCPSLDSSLLCPFLGIFPSKGVGKSDEDSHASVCAVSGVLTPPGEEERKKNHLILLSGTQS